MNAKQCKKLRRYFHVRMQKVRRYVNGGTRNDVVYKLANGPRSNYQEAKRHIKKYRERSPYAFILGEHR